MPLPSPGPAAPGGRPADTVGAAMDPPPGVVPISVVLPTVGRVALLERAIASLAACDPAPAEVLVCDQSGDDAVRALVEGSNLRGARVLRCPGRGIAANVNLGLREAAHPLVALTHDDCTVAPDWVGRAYAHAAAYPGGCIAGRVLPVGDPLHVPSVRVSETPADHLGGARFDLMMANNMVLDRAAALRLGGFDERPGLWRAGEDFDFCYRWTRAGLPVRYRPDMVVHHHDWRGPEQLADTYRTYARAKGVFYSAHIARGDWSLFRPAVRNLVGGLRSLASAVVRRRPAWTDHRRYLLVGVPVGLVAGWREERRSRRHGR